MMLEVGRDIKQLTGLRGVAALAVVFHHASTQEGGEWYLRGQPMVDIFFALSGFVISYVYLSKDKFDLRAFAVARFARIYPLHAMTALAMAAAVLAYAEISGQRWPDHINTLQALREATLTMAMPLAGAEKLWNYTAWSVSVEWWVYFSLFPLLVAYGKSISKMRAILIFLVASAVLAFVLHAELGKPTRSWLAFARAAVGFGGGWLAYRIGTTSPFQISARLADVLIAAVFLTIYLAYVVIDQDAWFLIPVYPMFILVIATSDSRATRLLRSRPVVWLGNISFSLYLIHPVILNVLEAVDAKIVPIEGRLQWIVVVIPCSIAASAITYALLETPARRLLQRWAAPRSSGSIA
ncbi:putative acyltransferase [Novosphingobium sp. AP12]|nr:putative acyltransferase [Novosphingobium sp. AP12]